MKARPQRYGASFEFRATALVELGRRVDEARAANEPARREIDEALARWEAALARLCDDNQTGDL